MTDALKKAWAEMVQPLLTRPKRLQVAALCYRKEGAAREVLLITSRDTGRWILPKGWPIDGLDAPGAALQEAWEEAGVKDGDINTDAIGSFAYEKEMDSGGIAPVEAKVFSVRVKKMSRSFPESDERTRKWVKPEVAASMVAEPGLQEILRTL